jgi:hypothetical protein
MVIEDGAGGLWKLRGVGHEFLAVACVCLCLLLFAPICFLLLLLASVYAICQQFMP